MQQIVGHGLELLDGSLYLGQCPPVMGLHIGFCSYGRAEHYDGGAEDKTSQKDCLIDCTETQRLQYNKMNNKTSISSTYN